ncbi:hypothetical protein [Celeribacter halophilus]|uniref:hypothetical protein n=1 Tax=Celeribacter halophilus TaxID=576117 RepID=UPI003A926BA4
MITIEQLRNEKPKDITVELAYTVTALIGTARRALDTHERDTNRDGDARVTLELAEQLASSLIDGCEMEKREAKAQTSLK